MEKLLGFIVTAGHLDIEWYQPLRSYRFWTVEALEQLKKIRETRNDFVTYCLDGQFFPLKEYLDVVPEDEQTMRDMIREGILTIGPFYTQFDEWIPSAEAMIRNCLYGERKCRSFGGYMRAGYLPDNFGHPYQLPQILQGFGIDSLLFMRGLPEIAGDHDDEMIYRGIDGSEVLVSHFRESYTGAFDIFDKKIYTPQPREVPYYPDYLSYEYHKDLADHDDPERIAGNLIENVRRIKDRYPSKIIPLIAGYDHLPPQINIGDSVRAANAMQDEIEFVMGDVEEYVRRVREKIGSGQASMQYDKELIGSKYQYILLGALSTRSYLKREHFACEALLEHYAEPMDAVASMYGYKGKRTLLDEAWEFMMINSAHDSIHGSSVDEVHIEMQARYAGVRQNAAGIIHDCLKYIGSHMTPWANPNEEVLAFSPTTAKGQIVEIWLPVNQMLPENCDFVDTYDQTVQIRRKKIALQDEKGILHPVQVQERMPVELNGNGAFRNNSFPGRAFERVLFEDDFREYELRRYRIVELEQASNSNSNTDLAGNSNTDLAGNSNTDLAGNSNTDMAPNTELTNKQDLTVSDSFIENPFIRVDVHNGLISVTDKRSGFSVHNLNLIEEDAEAGDAWDTSPTWTPGECSLSSQIPFTSRLVELGSNRAVIELSGEMDVPFELIGDIRSEKRVKLPMTFHISVNAHSPRVDVKLTINNTAKDHRLRLCVPGAVVTDFVRSQGQLAIIDRPVERQKEIEDWLQPPTQLLPCREWVAVQDDRHGLAVALKGMYDYEATMNPRTRMPDVRITLLRGFEYMGRINMMQREGDAAFALHTPGAQCLGEQTMEWSFIPYSVADDDKAPFIADAQAFLYPPVAHFIRGAHEYAAAEAEENAKAEVNAKAEANAKAENKIPDSFAPFRTEPANIQFSTFKQAYDQDGYILRLFENQGKQTTADIWVSPRFVKAEIADMNEHALHAVDIVNGCIRLDFGPYKAITVKLSTSSCND